jgi:UDP-N-acetylmuramate dehydrogenase
MEHFQELITKLQLAGVPLKQGEPMCRHTSFQIGGPVSVMVFPESRVQLQEVFALCRTYQVRPGILGAGTNVLAPDQGMDTMLIELKTNLNEIRNLGGGVLEAQAGAMLSRLAVTAMESGLTGLEFAHGIPGTVGGGVYMNAGAYGGEMCQVVTGVTAMDFSGQILEIPVQDLDLSYRHSRFMEENLVILSAKVQLEPGDQDTIQARMKELMGKRRASQPLEFPSAGSTFKRPAQGYAAALIENAGLKGFRVGGAQVSEKHAGFVINCGRATCGDVLVLMDEVSDRVFQHSGIRLEPEVRILEVQP